MFFQNKKLIGLDIGTANIKIAEVDYARKGSTLVNFAIRPTPPRAISGGELRQRIQVTRCCWAASPSASFPPPSLPA